jgi:hypothetical protein
MEVTLTLAQFSIIEMFKEDKLFAEDDDESESLFLESVNSKN